MNTFRLLPALALALVLGVGAPTAAQQAPAPVTVQPKASNGTGTPASLTPTFEWTRATGVLNTRLIVKTALTGGTTLLDTTVSGTSTTPPAFTSALSYGTTYYFKLNAVDDMGRWSDVSNTTSTVLADNYPPAAITFWILGIVTALLRYGMDAHWPSDVLGGAALGYAAGHFTWLYGTWDVLAI